MPSCNKDPTGSKGELWKVFIDVLGGLGEDATICVLFVVNQTSISVVKISPKWGDYVPDSIHGKTLRYVHPPWFIKGHVPIMVHLKKKQAKTFIMFN